MRLVLIVQRIASEIRYRNLHRIHREFRKYTMIPACTYIANLSLALKENTAKGAIVECGTWKGGMIAGIAKLLGNQRDYFLFDSFEGLPPVEPIDGPGARNWQANTESSGYHDNCTASEDDARSAMTLAGVRHVNIVKGWFENTLPTAVFPNGIAILRMDADWYSSTMQILESLFPAVNVGGLILIDDYYAWEGCSKAVHDYLSTNKRPERIQSRGGVCFIIKLAMDPVGSSEVANRKTE